MNYVLDGEASGSQSYHCGHPKKRKKTMEYLKIGKNWNMSKDVMYVQEYI